MKKSTNTLIDQMYAVSRDELEQIILYGKAILSANTHKGV